MSQTQVERLFIKDRTSLMTDVFRLTTTLTTTDADITANLERAAKSELLLLSVVVYILPPQYSEFVFLLS